MSVVRSAAVRLTMENASYIRGTTQAAAATEAATGRMQRSVRSAAVSTGRDWEAMGKYGGRYALAVGAGLAAVVKTTSDFTSEMALVRTLSHASASEMDKLSKAALTVGQKIGYSAKEVAQGEEEMIKAGISVKDILGGGLKGALDLAAAGQTDVATATSIAASALTQFKLTGKDVPHIADLLAAGADKALGSVQDLGYGLEQSGTTAHQMGLSIEQTVGTLAAFAQAGLIGERGGTTFKQMLLQLSSPTSQAKKLMDQYGLSLYNANGQIKTMPQLAGNLRQAFGHLSPEARNAALGVIFGSRAIQGANILMANGRTEIAKWISKVNDQGFAAHQASGKLDSLSGDMKKFKATLSTTFIEAGSPSQNALRSLVQDADHLVKAFSQLPAEVQQGTVKMLALTAGIGGTLYTISKVRKIAGELGGFGGRAATGRGGLGGVGGVGGPVPVFVTNMGPGGLGGAAGKGGGTTVLGEGAAASEGKVFGKIPLKAVGRASTAVGLSAMILEGLGFGKKWHAGSTLSLAAAGSFLGPVGTVGGAIIGSGIDIYHSGGGTKGALDRAKLALATGNIKEMKAALADLQATAAKLGTGGASQNFNRFVTEFTGRRRDIEETGKALQEAIDPKVNADQRASLLFLLSGGKRGHRVQPPKPEKDPLPALLGVNRPGGRKPKELTSEEVLANLYGINPKKLKPVDLLSDITGIANVFGGGGGKSGKGGKGKSPVVQLAASLGLDTSKFNKNAGVAKHTAANLNAMTIAPTVTVNTGQAMSQLGAFGSYLASLTRPRSVDVSVHIHKGAVGAGGSGGIGGLLNPGSADGSTVPKTGRGYADRHPYLLADGEEVISNRHGQADRHRGLLKAINANRLADGGTAGGELSTYSRSHPHETAREELKRFKKALDASTKSIDAEKSKRDDLIASRDQMASTVSGLFTSDIFAGKITGGNHLTQDPMNALRADIKNAGAFQSTLTSLAGRGLHGGAFQALAETGDVKRAQAFAALSPGDLAQYQSLYDQRQQAAASVGGFAGNQVYSAQINTSNQHLAALNAKTTSLEHEIKVLQKIVDKSGKGGKIVVNDKSGNPKHTAREVSRRQKWAAIR